jgi:hypothetical protein
VARNPKASIRKSPSGQWRGYIGDIRAAEFEDGATESAEAAAKRWLAEPTKPKKERQATPDGDNVVKELGPDSTAQTPATPSITIDTVGITKDQKITEKFKSAHRDMLAQLLRPDFIPVLCAHEAAHMVYFSQLESRNSNRYRLGCAIRQRLMTTSVFWLQCKIKAKCECGRKENFGIGSS